MEQCQIRHVTNTIDARHTQEGEIAEKLKGEITQNRRTQRRQAGWGWSRTVKARVTKVQLSHIERVESGEREGEAHTADR